MKNVLITGSEGFLGKNLRATLKYDESVNLLCYDMQDSPEGLSALLQEADFVFHLAGVNRPQKNDEYNVGNTYLTERICAELSFFGKQTPIVLSSSIQASFENPYGISKRGAESAVFSYGQTTGAPVFVFRLPNVFGKWCRPNYNSVVATFCHNIANDLPIQINDASVTMSLVYVDDVIQAFIDGLEGRFQASEGFCNVEPVYTRMLGDIAALIQSFCEIRKSCYIPKMSDPFVKKLYSTYLSYLPSDHFIYPLKMNVDHRGSFTEFLRTVDYGQVSINVSKPGVTKGNHWHHTKNEKFLVASGTGLIRFRRIGCEEIFEFQVSGEKLEVVDIPVGYVHCIINVGETDLVTVMWANESFDAEHPDTYFELIK